MRKGYNKELTKEKLQKANKYMKKELTTLVAKENQIETTM